MPILKLLPIHRVSTAAQAGDDGEGLDRQRDATRRIVETLNGKDGVTAIALPAVEIVDVSGSDVDQTLEWRHQVLPLIEERNVHIAVDAIDRILRAESFNFRVMQDLLRTSTNIYSPGQVHDLADPSDGFMAGLLALLGGREKAEIKRRMMAGREAARRRGEWPLRNSALPRGITYDRPTKTWGYDEPEAEVIKRIYRWFVVDGRRLHAIARDVGKPMQVISQYLKNPIYKGLLRWDQKRGEQYPSRRKRNGERKQPDRKKIKRLPHEVIEVRVFGEGCALDQLVSDWMWQAAQDRLASNAKDWSRARSEGQPETWASGFMVSALAPLDVVELDGFVSLDISAVNRHHVYANGGPVGERRYGCTCGRGSNDLDLCGFRGPRAEPVNRTIDAYLVSLTSEAWFLDAVKHSLQNPAPDSSASRRVVLEDRLKTLEERERRLTRLYLDGRIDPAAHDAEQDKIRADREVSRRSLSELDGKGALPSAADLTELASTWVWNPSWDYVKKREWLAKYVVAIHLSNAGVERIIVRIPAVAGDMPLFGTSHRMDWVERVFSRRAPRRTRKS